MEQNLRNYDVHWPIWLVLIEFFSAEVQMSKNEKVQVVKKSDKNKGISEIKSTLTFFIELHETFVFSTFENKFLTKLQ